MPYGVRSNCLRFSFSTLVKLLLQLRHPIGLVPQGFAGQAELVLDLRERVLGRLLPGQMAGLLLSQLRVAFSEQGLEPGPFGGVLT